MSKQDKNVTLWDETVVKHFSLTLQKLTHSSFFSFMASSGSHAYGMKNPLPFTNCYWSAGKGRTPYKSCYRDGILLYLFKIPDDFKTQK